MDTRGKVWDWVTFAIGLLLVIATALFSQAFAAAVYDHRWGAMGQPAGALLIVILLTYGVRKLRDRLGLYRLPWKRSGVNPDDEQGPY